MAPKRLSPLEDPPAASSAEEEEESEGIDEVEEQNDVFEEEDEEEEEEEEKSSMQKSTVTSVTAPQPHSPSQSDCGSESESDSDQTQRSPSASDFTVKPIVSKPMDDFTKHKKPRPQAGAKRPAETEPNEKESRTKKKTKALNGDKEDGVEESGKKGSGIQRLWSEDDEIAILKGMVDYHSKKGADPYADMGVFHEFIKKSLHVDVSKNQLMDKIRRLKKKYQTNTEKGENGEDPVFLKPHESKSFELSKKIWGGGGNNVMEDHVKNKRKARNSCNTNSVLALPRQEVTVKREKQEVIVKREASNGELKGELKGKLKGELNPELKGEKREEFWSLYPNMNEAVESGQFYPLSTLESGNSFVKERLTLIGSSKAKELEEKWRKLKVNEIELYLKRVELIQEQTKLILDAVKSSMS